MQIKIESNGNVTVSGIEDKEVREQVQKLVEEKYSDRMYQYYTEMCIRDRAHTIK